MLVLGPLALWAIYGLGARIAGRAFGLFSAAVWVVLPFAVIPLWRDDYHERYIEQFLPGALGLTGLADFQSMVLLLVGALLFMRALETRAAARRHRRRARGRLRGRREAVERALRRRAVRRRAAAHATCGRCCRSALALLPALADAGGVEAARARLAAGVRARGDAAGAAGAWSRSACPTSTATSTSTGPTCTTTPTTCASTSGARACSSGRRSPAPSAVARRSPPLAGLLATWFGAFLVVKGTTPLSTVSSGSFFRFLMPGFPAYFLLGVSILLLVPTLGASSPRRGRSSRPRALGPQARDRPRRSCSRCCRSPWSRSSGRSALPPKAVVVDEILTPVDEEIDVDVAGRRRGTRPHVDASAGRLERRLLSRLPDRSHRHRRRVRRPRRRQGVPLRDGPARDDARAALARRLAAARLRYRIGVAANSRNDPKAGDVATISEPVEGDA